MQKKPASAFCWALTTGLFLLAGCDWRAGVGSGAVLPLRAEVVLSATPGKPGAPTETIKVSKNGEICSIQVMRSHGSEPTEEKTAPLSVDEFRGLWLIVMANDLVSFRPEKKGNAFDFGERRVAIATADGLQGPLVRSEYTWDNTLANGERVRPLFREAKNLAVRHVAELQLYYLSDTE